MSRKGGPGRPFGKGNQAAKGHGRPSVPVDLRKARSLNRLELERILNRYLYMSVSELKAAWENPDTPALERIVMGLVKAAVEQGDVARFDFLLNRLVGKVKEQPREHHHMNFAMMPRREVIAMGQEALEFLERLNRDDAETDAEDQSEND